MPHITLHGLRHSFASVAINETNTPMIIIENILGHYDSRMIHERYGHIYDDRKAEEIKKISNAINNSDLSGGKMVKVLRKKK